MEKYFGHSAVTRDACAGNSEWLELFFFEIVRGDRRRGQISERLLRLAPIDQVGNEFSINGIGSDVT
jgi:hypothetical protein